MRTDHWSPEDDLKLVVLKARGVPTDRIARLLDRGSPMAIRDRLQRLREKLRNEQSLR